MVLSFFLLVFLMEFVILSDGETERLGGRHLKMRKDASLLCHLHLCFCL